MGVRYLKDLLFRFVLLAVTSLPLIALAHLLATIMLRGGEALLKGGIQFLTSLPPRPGSGEVGGIGPSLVGTLILTLMSTALGFPISVALGVLIFEFPNSLVARAARLVSESLMELPTILVGMLVYVLIVVPSGTFSALAGAVALAVIMVPYVTTYVEESLKAVPSTYREAAYALGLSRGKVVFKIVLGIARRGVLAGGIMGVARAMGETAPLLFTVGGVRNHYVLNPLRPSDAIPLLIYEYATSPYPNWHLVAWGAALTLVATYFAVFFLSRLVVKEVGV